MLSDAEYRAYLDQPKHTLAKLKSISQKIVGTLRDDLKGKTRKEVIDHLIKYSTLDESMNIHLRHEVSLINSVSLPKSRQPRSDKGKPRGSRKPKEVMKKVEVMEKPIEKLEPMKPKKKLIRKPKMME